MRNYVLKQKQSQKPDSSSLARSSTAISRPQHPSDLIQHLQRRNGKQIAQEKLQAHTEALNSEWVSQRPPHVARDFSQIPMYAYPKGLIHTKLPINNAKNESEREADRNAEQIMRMPEPQLQQPHACSCSGKSPWYQEEQERGNHLQAGHVQTDDTKEIEIPPTVNEELRSPDHPLDPAIRTFFELRFGYDFSGVRIHRGNRAEQSARALNARAFTVGNDIVFGANRFEPGTAEGKKLLAHELTHVVQQREGIHRQVESEENEPGLFEEEPLEPGFRRTGPGGKFQIGGSLPYREATEYAKCIQIMGPENRDYCAEEVLGIKPPMPTHHKIPGITTPQPIALSPSKAGSATQLINGVKIIFLPDTNSSSKNLTMRGKTKFRIKYNIRFKGSKASKKVTAFSGPGTFVEVQTLYGPKASPSSPSHYGRGTTAEDKAAGNTSLGFHESSHGFDILQFIGSNPLPKFTGKVGDSITSFKAAQTAYAKAIKAYRKALCKFTVERTECVGTTIDTFNAGQGKTTSCCSGNPLDCC